MGNTPDYLTVRGYDSLQDIPFPKDMSPLYQTVSVLLGMDPAKEGGQVILRQMKGRSNGETPRYTIVPFPPSS